MTRSISDFAPALRDVVRDVRTTFQPSTQSSCATSQLCGLLATSLEGPPRGSVTFVDEAGTGVEVAVHHDFLFGINLESIAEDLRDES